MAVTVVSSGIRILALFLRFVLLIVINKYYSTENIKIFTESLAFAAIFSGLAGAQLFYYLLREEKAPESVAYSLHKTIIYLSILALILLRLLFEIPNLYITITVIELLTLEISRIYMVKKEPNMSNSIFIVPPLIYGLSVCIDMYISNDLSVITLLTLTFVVPLLFFYFRLNSVELSSIKNLSYGITIDILKVIIPMIILQVSNLYFLQYSKFIVLEQYNDLIFIKFSNTLTLFNVVNTFLFSLFIVKQPYILGKSRYLRRRVSCQIIGFHLIFSFFAVLIMRFLSNAFGFMVLENYQQLILLMLITLFLLLPQILTFGFVHNGTQNRLVLSVIPGLLVMLALTGFISTDSIEFFLMILLGSVGLNYIARLILLRFDAS